MHTENTAEEINDFSDIAQAADAADYVDYLKHNDLPRYQKYQEYLKQTEHTEKHNVQTAFAAARDEQLDRGSRRMSRLLAGGALVTVGLIGLLFHANKFFSKNAEDVNTDPTQKPDASTPT